MRGIALAAMITVILLPLAADTNAEAGTPHYVDNASGNIASGCADSSRQLLRAVLWWLPVAAAYRDEAYGDTAITLLSPLDGSWHGDGQFRLSYRIANLPAGARIRVELDGEDVQLAGAAEAVVDSVVTVAPGTHVLSVLVLVARDGDEDAIATQVSSTLAAKQARCSIFYT